MKKLVLLLGLTSLITACGGGSGTKSNAPSAPVTALSFGQVENNISIDESSTSQFSVPVDYNGKNTLTYTAEVDVDSVGISISDGVVTLNATDISAPEEAFTISVVVSDGMLSDSVAINATVINTSLGLLFIEVTEKSVGLENVLLREATQNVITRYTEQAWMLGNIDKAEMNSIRSFMISSMNQRSEDLSVALSSLPANLGSVLSEIELTKSFKTLDDAIIAYSESASEFIESMSDLGDLGLPALSSEVIVEGQLRPFFGNPAYGQTQNGSFTYSNQYALFEYIAPENQTVCLASNS